MQKLACLILTLFLSTCGGGHIAFAEKSIIFDERTEYMDEERGIFVLRNSPGGNVLEFTVRFVVMSENDIGILVGGQTCDSACTLVFGYSGRWCAQETVNFGFHTTRVDPEKMAEALKIFKTKAAVLDYERKVTDAMYRTYPAWVRSWIDDNGGLTKRIKRMPPSVWTKYMKPCGG